MLHLNDHFMFKTMCLLWAVNFGVALQASHAYTLSQAPTVGIMYNHIYQVFHSMGYLSLLAITRHIFSFSCIQPCDFVRHRPMVLSPPNQSPNTMLIITQHSHPFNAMSPCICNAMCHCMLYHATCIMNATWTT